jgi:hypothetical protein
MRFGISTLKRTISALVVCLVLLAGMIVPAEAQRRHGRWAGRHDNGRHLGWTRGRHLGWRNRRFNDDDRFRRRSIRRHWRDERRALRRHQREERRGFRNRARGDRVRYIGPPVRVSNRRQFRESRRWRN